MLAAHSAAPVPRAASPLTGVTGTMSQPHVRVRMHAAPGDGYDVVHGRLECGDRRISLNVPAADVADATIAVIDDVGIYDLDER